MFVLFVLLSHQGRQAAYDTAVTPDGDFLMDACWLGPCFRKHVCPGLGVAFILFPASLMSSYGPQWQLAHSPQVGLARAAVIGPQHRGGCWWSALGWAWESTFTAIACRGWSAVVCDGRPASSLCKRVASRLIRLDRGGQAQHSDLVQCKRVASRLIRWDRGC